MDAYDGENDDTLDEDTLNLWLQECDVSEDDSKTILVRPGHPLDYAYSFAGQIIVNKTGEGQGLPCNSAQSYYQSEKSLLMNNPRLAETVRVADNPLRAGFVPEEDFDDNWYNLYKIDTAFRANWLKFTQNDDLAEQLLSTGNSRIVSRNNCSWGEITGKILMVIREILRRKANR
uniref:NADAR domain-containing protein n=1 Tax=Tetranychus urticae TaxID=32264 RepID=T1L1V1_TETUR